MSHFNFTEEYLYAVKHQHELVDEIEAIQEQEYKLVYNEWFNYGCYNELNVDQQEYGSVTELYNALVELNIRKRLHEINVNVYYTKTKKSDYLDTEWWVSIPVSRNKQSSTLVLDFYEDGLYSYHEVQISEEAAAQIEDIASPIYYIGIKEIETLLSPIIRKEIIDNYFVEV